MNDQIKVNGVQYRQLTRKCGKPGCKCQRGEPHGPYWYAFGDTGAAKYVGANLPEHVTKHIALLKSMGPKLKTIKTKILKERDLAQDALRKAERELTAVRNLESGEYIASEVLKSLGLSQFNGHSE
jgi:uncharacterized protein DUF6788